MKHRNFKQRLCKTWPRQTFLFAGVPIYDSTDPDTFDDWLYQIESLCEMSHRDVRIELMGWASAQVKHIIRSIPLDIEWEVA